MICEVSIFFNSPINPVLKLLINPNLVRKYLHHLFQCPIMAWELAGGKDQHVQTLSSLNWINKYFLDVD